MTPKEHVDLSTYPSVDISYKSAKEHYSGQVAALMDKLSHSKTAAKAKAMQPQDFKWSLVFNRSDDPPHTTDPAAFTSYLCANSECWLKARGGGWKQYEEINSTPPQIKAQYEQRANLICQQRKAAELGESNGDTPQINDELNDLSSDLMESFEKLSRHGDPRLASVARSALEMLIEDVLE